MADDQTEGDGATEAQAEPAAGPRKRKAIPKAVRFEVFKRDKFTCQYCGAKAPDVVLVLDHLHPHAKGGDDTVINLITSCEPCNNGKRDRLLTDDTIIAKQRTQLEQLQERRDQLTMMMEWQRELAGLADNTVSEVDKLYRHLVPGWSLNEHGMGSVKMALAHYSAESIATMLRECAAKYVRLQDGNATDESSTLATNAFLKELKYRRWREKDPTGTELRYIRGIIKNQSYRWDNSRGDYCLSVLKEAHGKGHSIDELRRIAQQSSCWSDWSDTMNELLKGA